MGRNFRKNGSESFGVELGRAVVTIDTVLLLLYVGDLCIAIAYDARTGDDGIDFLFQNAVEVVERVDVATIAPRCGAFLLWNPGQSTELVKHIGLTFVFSQEMLVGLVAIDGLAIDEGMVLDQFLGVALVVVDSPDVCLDVTVSAGIVDGARGVDGFGEVIDISHHALVGSFAAAPCLIEWCPGDYARMIAVADDEFRPFGEEITCGDVAVLIDTPAGLFAPGEVAEVVCPIIVTFLEGFLMKSCTIEANGLAEFDILSQGFVRRCRPNAIRIEPLIEYEPLEIGLVVEVEVTVLNVYLTHTSVGLHLVDDIAFAVANGIA